MIFFEDEKLCRRCSKVTEMKVFRLSLCPSTLLHHLLFTILLPAFIPSKPLTATYHRALRGEILTPVWCLPLFSFPACTWASYQSLHGSVSCRAQPITSDLGFTLNRMCQSWNSRVHVSVHACSTIAASYSFTKCFIYCESLCACNFLHVQWHFRHVVLNKVAFILCRIGVTGSIAQPIM